MVLKLTRVSSNTMHMRARQDPKVTRGMNEARDRSSLTYRDGGPEGRMIGRRNEEDICQFFVRYCWMGSNTDCRGEMESYYLNDKCLDKNPRY